MNVSQVIYLNLLFQNTSKSNLGITPYYSFYISQIQLGTWRCMQMFNRVLSRMLHKKSTQKLSISAHKSINSYIAPYYSFDISQIQLGTWQCMQMFNRIVSRMCYKQWCYAVGAGGSAAPIVFLTVGAPLPYFFKWAEYN